MDTLQTPFLITDHPPAGYCNMDQRIKDLIRRRDEVHAALELAKEVMGKNGPIVEQIPYKEGDSVWLSSKHLNIAAPSNKLRA